MKIVTILFVFVICSLPISAWQKVSVAEKPVIVVDSTIVKGRFLLSEKAKKAVKALDKEIEKVKKLK